MSGSIKEPTPAALRARSVTLRAELTAAREKARRLSAAIESRQKSLSRLEAQIAMTGDLAPARITHG